MEPLVFEDRVSKGVELLNEYGPTEWWSDEKLDLDVLDIADPSFCVLGQLYESYWDGIDSLVERYGDRLDEMECGFTLYEVSTGDFEHLTDAWSAAITKIREEAAA